MGKYLIRFESMDGDREFDDRFSQGIECDGFCVLAKDGEKNDVVAIHNMNIDVISDVIKGSHHVLAAGILAKAKRDIIEVCRDGEKRGAMRDLLNLLK